MTKPTYILIRESSNESGYTAHSFPTETSAYKAMDCMVESDAAAIETTYHLSPRVEQVSSYKTQLIFDAVIAEFDMTVKITYSVYAIENHGSLAVVYFLFFFMLIFSNSFGPLDRGTFPAVPAR